MKKEIITINNQKILIKELTVNDVCTILDSIGDVLEQDELDFERIFKEKKDIIIHMANSFIVMPDKLSLADLKRDHIDLVHDAFMRVNHRYFDSKKEQIKQNPRAKKRQKNAGTKSLNRTVLIMIQRGFKDVLNYPYSLYLDAIELMEEQEKDNG